MILEIILVSLIILLGYSSFNLLKKVERLEDIVKDQQQYMQRVSEVIEESRILIRTVDEKGVFESDDDIGAFFNYLKIIQGTLDSYKLPELNGKKTNK